MAMLSRDIYFDRTNTVHLIAAAGMLTLGAALCYWLLSQASPAHGLSSTDHLPISFAEALYFSITTETTLGYGDIAPVGFSRILACLQVICGLVLAGMAVAKITSLPGTQLHRAVYQSSGDWIEYSRLKTGILISISKIYWDGSVLRYDGENFNSLGEPQGTFVGELKTVQSPTFLDFTYKNTVSSDLHYSEGTVHARFSGPTRRDKWNRITGTVHDVRDGVSFYKSCRANDEERKIINGSDDQALRRLVLKYADQHFGAKSTDTLDTTDKASTS